MHRALRCFVLLALSLAGSTAFAVPATGYKLSRLNQNYATRRHRHFRD